MMATRETRHSFDNSASPTFDRANLGNALVRAVKKLHGTNVAVFVPLLVLKLPTEKSKHHTRTSHMHRHVV